MIKRSEWLSILKDRMALLLLFLIVVGATVLIITTILRVHASDIQIPVRFTGYGQSNIDRDQWYSLFGFAGFGILVAAVNGFIAIKLYPLGRMLGLGFLTLSVFVLILACIVANAIFNLSPTI